MTDGSDKERLQKLGSRLDDARHAQGLNDAPETTEKASSLTGIGLAFRVGVELLSAVAVGGGMGWLLDWWLDTRPWLMMVFILLGGAAGILNVYRISSGYGYTAGYKKTDDKAGDAPGGDQGN